MSSSEMFQSLEQLKLAGELLDLEAEAGMLNVRTAVECRLATLNGKIADLGLDILRQVAEMRSKERADKSKPPP